MKILIDKEVLQQAMKVLQGCLEHPEAYDAIAGLQSAIEQAAPEQEPTTFEYKVGDKVFVLNKPYMSAPENGVRYWVIDGLGLVMTFNCWKTKEDAEAFAAADLEHKKFLMGESRR